jgi:AmmeMemoRadiSam system protein B
MNVRAPFRANQFYPGPPMQCRQAVEALLDAVEFDDALPESLVGGVCPHAGWVYSGLLAATTLKALATRFAAPSVVLLGADHTGLASGGAVFARGAWATPLGELDIDEDLADRLLAADARFADHPKAHTHEHSLEVQVPFIQVLWPGCKLVPIMIEPSPDASELGKTIAQVASDRGDEILILGSTDLTHHGGHFPAPGGHGLAGVSYTEDNDQRMIELMKSLDAESVIGEVLHYQNACGAGAIAATLSACRGLGATQGVCLGYDNSYQISRRTNPHETDETTVGYASVVFA